VGGPDAGEIAASAPEGQHVGGGFALPEDVEKKKSFCRGGLRLFAMACVRKLGLGKTFQDTRSGKMHRFECGNGVDARETARLLVSVSGH
jgi:hypothetical protein